MTLSSCTGKARSQDHTKKKGEQQQHNQAKDGGRSKEWLLQGRAKQGMSINCSRVKKMMAVLCMEAMQLHTFGPETEQKQGAE